jgi:hypothetical protein
VVNWRIYNESLVRRGEIVLDFDVIDNWNSELNRMDMIVKKVHHNDTPIHSFNYSVICEYTFIYLIDRLKM